MFNRVNMISETMCKNHKALGLVSMMQPIELMKALVKHKDLLPKDAAKVILDLKKKVEGMVSPGIETNKEFPVPASMRGPNEEDEEFEEIALGRPQGKSVSLVGPPEIKRHHFPPDPRADSNDYPYDDTFVNYMNNPKRKRPMMSHVEIDPEDLGSEPILPGGTRAGNVKHKNPLDIDFRSGQPGGDGAGGGGIYQKSRHSRDNDMPSQGRSWNIRGPAGWASVLQGHEFEVPPKSIKKAGPVELSQPVSSLSSRGPDNAGDNEYDIPSFMKNSNTGAQISVVGYGGPTPVRVNRTGYRGYGRK